MWGRRAISDILLKGKCYGFGELPSFSKSNLINRTAIEIVKVGDIRKFCVVVSESGLVVKALVHASQAHSDWEKVTLGLDDHGYTSNVCTCNHKTR
jgi:hypothetical protein